MKYIYDNFEVILIALASLIIMVVALLHDDKATANLYAISFWANVIILNVRANK